LVALCHHKIELLIKLKKGLLLADLLGVAPKDVKQPLRHWFHDENSTFSYPTPWKRVTLFVQIGDAEKRGFPLAEVDRYLWPADMQKAWDKYQKSKDKNKE
jgi:hypothetical protein